MRCDTHIYVYICIYTHRYAHTHPCSHPNNQDIKYFHQHNESLPGPSQSVLLPCTSNCWSIFWPYRLGLFCSAIGIIRYVHLFLVWLLLLNAFLRFTYILVYISSLFLFIVESYSVVWTYPDSRLMNIWVVFIWGCYEY